MEISEQRVKELMDVFDKSGDGALQLDEFENIPPDFFTGSPSTPGFKMGEFDKLSSWTLSTSSNQPIVAEYKPDDFWLWTKWGEYMSMHIL